MPDRLKPLADWARRRGRWIAAAAVLVAAAWTGGWMAGDYVPGQKVQLTAAKIGLTAPRPPEAPPQLKDELARLVEAYGEDVGVAVTDVKAGWTADVSEEIPYPQQSVSKLWVAVAVLKAVDEGRMQVDGPVVLTDDDRSVFFQPITHRIRRGAYATDISALLRQAITESDNAANDKLIREAGGPESVGQTLLDMGLTGVSVGAYERDLQAQTAGLPWRPEYGYDWAFQHARERLPIGVRKAAMDAYLESPPDGAAPAAITQALAALKRGELLSPASTERLLALLTEVRTGPRRLKGGLPPGWSIGHKTGTGQDFMGASVGINDVGLLTAPDGRTYAVAVMMRRTRHGVPARLAFMQSVTRAVAAHWARENAEPLAPDIGVAAVRPTMPESRDGL